MRRRARISLGAPLRQRGNNRSGCFIIEEDYRRYLNGLTEQAQRLGCFRSCLPQNTHYVLACYRNIEMNPVRAAMVRHPRAYDWSSFAANGDGRKDPLITPHDQYLALGRSVAARASAYRALFKTQISLRTLESIRLATNGNTVLGERYFQEQLARKLKRRVTRGKAGRPAAD